MASAVKNWLIRMKTLVAPVPVNSYDWQKHCSHGGGEKDIK